MKIRQTRRQINQHYILRKSCARSCARKYHKKHWWSKYHFWDSVAFLLLIMAIVCFVGHKSRLAEIAQSKINVYASEMQQEASVAAELKSENTHLQIVAKVATASSQPVWLTTTQAKTLIAIVIPDKSAQLRFFNIISKCENGPKLVDGQLRFNPLRINENKSKDGKVWSYDLGFSQINSYFHADQVKAMFGQDFDSAMSDPAKNIMFAAWLYDHSHNFTAWACDKKVK